MPQKERKQGSLGQWPGADVIRVPSMYWHDLKNMNIQQLCRRSLAKLYPDGNGLQLPFLHKELLVDFEVECLREFIRDGWERVDYPLLELMTLVYLRNVTPDTPMHEMISVPDLKDAQFFQGPHELKTRPLLEIYGHNLKGFQTAAENLGGKALNMADAAFEFLPFPKIPLYYLFWEGDEEFAANLSILFDRSIERHLSADAIWGVVNLVSGLLMTGG